MTSKNAFLAITWGVGLTLALLITLDSSSQTTRAAATNWFAAPNDTGTCAQNNPCSLKTAVTQAGDGDAVYLAPGSYTSTTPAVIDVTESITLYGGWDGAASGPIVRDPDTYATILDGENGRRVIYITGTVTPRLEGLILQRGSATGLGGDPFIAGADVGGGLYAFNASPVVTGCRILSSTAGFGAGLALYYGNPRLEGNEIQANTAQQIIGPNTRGAGGGIFLYHSPASVKNNLLANNSAHGSGLSVDGGGGLYLDNSPAMVEGNTIKDNQGWPQGGGMFMLMSSATIEANTLFHNAATQRAGGIHVAGCNPFTLTNNIVAENHTTGPSGVAAALWVEGESFTSRPSDGRLIHNTFALNHPYPWAIWVGGPAFSPPATVTLTNTLVTRPGGIWVDQTGFAALHTTLWDASFLPFPGETITGDGPFISNTNYYSDPGFIGPTFHIGPGSAALDLAAATGTNTDVDGELRPNGARADIGADEFYCYGISTAVITGPASPLSGTGCLFTALVSPPTATQLVTYTWQATDQPITSRLVYSLSDRRAFTWTTTGSQRITVTATNCGGSADAAYPVFVYAARIYLPLVTRDYP